MEATVNLTQKDIERAIKRHVWETTGLRSNGTPVRWSENHSVELAVEDEGEDNDGDED